MQKIGKNHEIRCSFSCFNKSTRLSKKRKEKLGLHIYTVHTVQQDYIDSPSPIPTLDWDFLNLDWSGVKMGLGNWTWACQYYQMQIHRVSDYFLNPEN